MELFNFEKLETWQLSRKLVGFIYQITKSFPEEEKFGMTNQLRRASISISSNIAEGNSRFSAKDKSHFTEMSYTSLMEVVNQLILSNDLKYISDEKLEELKLFISPLASKIIGLYKYQRRSKSKRD